MRSMVEGACEFGVLPKVPPPPARVARHLPRAAGEEPESPGKESVQAGP